MNPRLVSANAARFAVRARASIAAQPRSVTIPLDARLSNGVIEVTGSLPIVFNDYSIQKPTSLIVLSVADEGTMELQLFFTKST